MTTQSLRDAAQAAADWIEAMMTTPGYDGMAPREVVEMLHQSLAADKAQDAQQCRSDGRCQYAIDYGAEGLGHCPKGKCCMPGNELKNSARYEYLKSLDYAQVTYIVEHSPDKWDAKIDADMQEVKP